MTQAKPLPSQDLLRKLLHYDPETGKLYWKERPREMFSRDQSWKTWNTRYAGTEAFTSLDSKGYRYGALFHKPWRAHRIIWKWMTGEDPDEVDHEKGIRHDNRWSKLSDVSHSGNHRNRGLQSTNTSGSIGVYWSRKSGKWCAGIKMLGKTKHLGTFDTKADAIVARKAAERELGFHPNHGRAA